MDERVNAFISLMKKILDNVFVNVGITYLHSKLGNLETFQEAFDYDSCLSLPVLPSLLWLQLLLILWAGSWWSTIHQGFLSIFCITSFHFQPNPIRLLPLLYPLFQVGKLRHKEFAPVLTNIKWKNVYNSKFTVNMIILVFVAFCQKFNFSSIMCFSIFYMLTYCKTLLNFYFLPGILTVD